MDYNLVLFYLFAALAVVSTLLVVAQPNPIYSVLLLIASFMGLAGLYVLLDAPFVAVSQIIIYAGAIMVLFLFVVMLLNVKREDHDEVHESGGARALGTFLTVVMASELVWALSSARGTFGALPGGAREAGWSVGELGRILFREYAFAFEATSVLILIAMVGAITLAGRHVTDRIAQPRVPNPESRIPNPAGDTWRD